MKAEKMVDATVFVALVSILGMFGYRFATLGAPPFSEFLIVPSCFFGLFFAYFQFGFVRKISVEDESLAGKSVEAPDTPEGRVPRIYNLIMDGAISFLRMEYGIAAIFCLCFGGVILAFITWGSHSLKQGVVTAIAFWTGAITSMGCGYLGMMIATYSNARTTLAAKNKADGYTKAFNTAFRGGAVMGYALCSIGVLVLWILLTIFRNYFTDVSILMDCVAGYGLGGSTVAMFGRVGGGIYTKAADVGADLVGKVVAGLEEDDPNNPAAIADNVGDNVGDIAGMGADLFGSFAESTCAALVIASATSKDWEQLLFPVAISASGIVVCALCSFLATHIKPVRTQPDIENVLKVQMVLTAILMLPVIYGLAVTMLPEDGFELRSVAGKDKNATVLVTPLKAFVCTVMGTRGKLLSSVQ